MFCDACGATLQTGQGYCTRCGKQVIGPVVAGSGRVARHTHLLGILWIAYSAISLLCGAVLIVVSHTVFGPFGLHTMPGGPPVFVRPLLQLVAMALLVKGGLCIAAGVGLLQRQPWARTLAIVLGCIILFLFIPFGTALGIYTLWVLLSPGAVEEYRGLAQGAAQ